jgi:hypothetical protein
MDLLPIYKLLALLFILVSIEALSQHYLFDLWIVFKYFSSPSHLVLFLHE